MLKESSGIDQPQCGQEWFKELSVRAAHCQTHSFIIRQVRTRERVKDQEITSWPHVAQVKRVSGNGQEHSQSQIIISLTLHHLSKFDFRHHLILPVLISLPLRDFGFSSPVIVIVKINFVI